MTEIQCVVDAKAKLGESTCWDLHAKCLWWIDIYSKCLHRYDAITGSSDRFSTPDAPGSLAVRKQGGLVVAMDRGFHFFDVSSNQFTKVGEIDPPTPGLRMNDGKTDRQGRFWAGTVFEPAGGQPTRPIAALFKLDIDLSHYKVVDGIVTSNGLAWSPDSRTMYFADSSTPYVWAWNFDPISGEVENRRIFIDLSSINGVCDGATVDAEGGYWLTMPFKGKVARYAPDGKLMRTIELPTSVPTCCEFGGDNLDILYVTTATLTGTPAEVKNEPLAGALLAIDVGVKGIAACTFAG
jgi:sugar lactone lactonase YvrE